jgi:hypothetical protein
MPLVSGVCRTASAPTLSHGGSRLNASKPEANPKTSCPTVKKNEFSQEIQVFGKGNYSKEWRKKECGLQNPVLFFLLWIFISDKTDNRLF